MIQANSSIDEFYATINYQLSLLINKLKTEDCSQDTVTALTENYRNRALDVFVRGLNGNLSKMSIIQKETCIRFWHSWIVRNSGFVSHQTLPFT